ncbi:SpoIIE family protein phosphatase [Kineococcus rubinsiae]|uniref:SpoIIE family protein phosphatase n=1 Tax=Kineococcus rubinsiae TaxID=2609562 RepID=UPI001431B72A|nr:SpoIIE family protein phosphatase [Kineococcus rubinsiae]NIZ90864.1 SpoIIE family protein phosphatase [Kineococcus rubinsiae]
MSSDTGVTVATAAEMSLISGTGPAAVLLVDLDARTVVYSNPVAEQLAPGVSLPVPLDAWSDAASLRDVDGAALSRTTHPLSRVARSSPVAGQAVSAARVSELGRQREPLWVIALPMLDAPMLQGHALVVLLPLRDRATAQAAVTAARSDADLRDRAVLATGLAFTVADARDDDLPLVWVNPAFTTTTGYSLEESVGRNCRFLQGSATDRTVVAEMRAGLAAGETVVTTVLNYRKDGTAFWNQLSMSPIHDASGELTHYVGIQADVTHRVAADAERDRALEAEREARRAAEEAHRETEVARARLALLAEATSQLAVTLDVAECRRRLVDLVVPSLADWVIVASTDAKGVVEHLSGKHRDPARAGEVERYVERLQAAIHPGGWVERLLGGSTARRIPDYGSAANRAERRTWVTDGGVLDESASLGAASVLMVPLPHRRQPRDLMILVRGEDSPAHTDDDLGVALDLGRRAGLILDNARLYQEQHRIAETLQRSLLPELPPLEGVTAAARYRASESGAEVGGDFYELVDLPGDAFGLAIGDVVGHDVLAAAAMGHLRGLLRACAWDTTRAHPHRVLERVDDLMAALRIPTLATLAYARLEQAPDGGWAMAYASAGHPPLMVRHPGGRVELLAHADDLLLGVQPGPRTSTWHHLEPGSTVLAYTDGLVERRGEDLGVGLERLRAAFEAAPVDVEGVCDHLLRLNGDSEDDVALLVVTV